MNTFMKYACPLMMLVFPSLIFAADTLRQLSAKSKGVVYSEIMRQEIKAGAVCDSEVFGRSAIGGIYSIGERCYRCVTIFDAKYRPVGAAWVELNQDESVLLH